MRVVAVGRAALVVLVASILGACHGTASDGSARAVERPHVDESPLEPSVPGGRVLTVRAHSGAMIGVELLSSDFQTPDEELVRWVERGVAAIEAYFGRFPLERLRITVEAKPGRRVVFGQASPRGIRMLVGREATRSALDRDWTLTHEMVHLSMPSIAGEHHWLEEGSATYVEPIARALAGQRTQVEVWREFTRDYWQGLPAAGDRGLDRTPTWGRTYYGGALWCLLADVELRKATSNAFGWQQALAAVAATGADICEEWRIEKLMALADRAAAKHGASGDVLKKLYAAHAETPVDVDLAALWRDLGVVRSGRTITFDDTAPLAAIRRAIVP